MQRKLFISFTGLVQALLDNVLSDGDLATGLYYLGCTREHAYHPCTGNFDELQFLIRDDASHRARVHTKIERVLSAAEDGRRALWRRDGEQFCSLLDLNFLLANNKLSQVRMYDETQEGRRMLGYSYALVDSLVQEAQLPLQVIY